MLTDCPEEVQRMGLIRFVKIIILFSTAVLLFSSLYGNVLAEIYHGDYEHVTRLVIVTSDKPDYDIERYERMILVSIDGIAKVDVKTVSIETKVIGSITVEKLATAGKYRVLVNTKGTYYLETFFLNGSRNRIVLDIFTKQIPHTLDEKVSFVNFFTTVGYHDRAIPLIQDIKRSNPEYTGINYYWGKILSNRNQIEEAVNLLKQVSYDQNEYLPAQLYLMKLGVLEVELTGEMQQLFLLYRDYFLVRENIDQQRFITAMVGLMSADRQRGIELFALMDDSEAGKMLNLFHRNLELLASDRRMQAEAPQIRKLLSPAGRGRLFTVITIPIMLAGILIIVLLIMTVLSMKKKVEYFRDLTEFSDYQNDSNSSKNDYDKVTEDAQKAGTGQCPVRTVPTEEAYPSDTGKDDDETPSSETDYEHQHSPEMSSDRSGTVGTGTDDELPSIANEELRKELAIKLSEQGWDIKSIAKELQTTEDEIESFLEDNSGQNTDSPH